MIRPIKPDSPSEIELVATRMRLTLIEVLGEEVGGSMYTMEWLVERVRWHLDPAHCIGTVLLAEDETGAILGHTILRVQSDDEVGEHGLFSTFYVDPAHRGKGVATAFVRAGEAWMRDQGMTRAMTYTATNNSRLRNLMASQGYGPILEKNDMVVLAKQLAR